jgi:Protein of unknown function (DUF2971)
MVDVPGLYVPGEWLAHYTTASTAFEYILPSGELRMSPYRLMRDPVENRGPSFRADVGAFGSSSDTLWRAVELANEVHQSARLFSLTHDALEFVDGSHDVFGCAWARPRLWEQYADRHRGVCLLFQRARFEDAIASQLNRLGLAYYLGDVSYTAAGYAASVGKTLTDPRIFDSETAQVALFEHIHRHRQDFFFLKSDDWRTEHEYRAVIFGHAADFACVPFADSLAAVILGEQFPAWQVEGAVRACVDARTAIKRVRWLGGRPVLHDEPPEGDAMAPE